MNFKKYNGKIFGVQLNKNEQRALDQEINRQIIENDRRFDMDKESSILWMLHVHFGFGPKRLKKAWELFYSETVKLREYYQMEQEDDRCWEHKANLTTGIQTALTQGLLRGDSSQTITDAVKHKFGVSRYKAGRLVHTETTYFNAVSALETYKDLDVEEIEILETLDRFTCEICRDLDGKVIPLSQYEPGVTVPPFHPSCRGTTCPHFDDGDFERIARKDNGEKFFVPANMTYCQWEQAFLGGGSKSGLTPVTVAKVIRDYNSEFGKKFGKDHYDQLSRFIWYLVK